MFLKIPFKFSQTETNKCRCVQPLDTREGLSHLKHNTGYIIHTLDVVVTMTTERLYSLPSCILLRGCSNHGNRRLQKRMATSEEVPRRGANIGDSTNPPPKTPRGEGTKHLERPLKHIPGTDSLTFPNTSTSQ